MKNSESRQAEALRAMLRTLNEEVIDPSECIRQEMAKDAKDVDAGLVMELLDDDHGGQLPDKMQQELWRGIEQRMYRRQERTRHILRLSAAVAAVAIIGILASATAARAFDWSFFSRIWSPLAQQFGFVANDTHQSSAVVEQSGAKPSEDFWQGVKETTEEYSSEADIPEYINGYAIRPKALPQGYKFVRGVGFFLEEQKSYTLTYGRDGTELFVKTSIYADAEAAAYTMFEKNTAGNDVKSIDGVDVFITLNHGVLSARWLSEYVSYSIWGSITQQELEELVRSLIGG